MKATSCLSAANASQRKTMTDKNQFPSGWHHQRVQEVLAHYDQQSEDEAVAEDEAAFADQSHTAMDVPIDLVPSVREMIAKHQA